VHALIQGRANAPKESTMQPRALIAVLSLAALATTATSAVANPLPVGWTERPCVIVDARQFVLDLATGSEIVPNASGIYSVAGIDANLADGRLVDGGGAPLSMVGGAIVDKAGKAVAMVSYWPRLACAPGSETPTVGPAGPAGVQGAAGAQGTPGIQGLPGVTTQALAPPVDQSINLRRQLVKARAEAKRWRKAAKAARAKRPAAALPVVLG
jgi:hypothetical protein